MERMGEMWSAMTVSGNREATWSLTASVYGV
jgi:hypothetical protein